jgi:hypothetical protein
MFFSLVCVAFFAVLSPISFCASPAETVIPLRLNLSWTSESPQKWEGEISLENGIFVSLIPLGSDPSAPVTFYPSEDRKTLSISSLEPSAYCGVQVTTAAVQTGQLSLAFHATDGNDSFSRTFLLSELRQETVRIPLDGDGHDLVIERAAGDRIPVSILHLDHNGSPIRGGVPSMVFEDGETLLVRVPVNRLPAGSAGRQIIASLKSTGTSVPVWTSSETLDSLAPSAVIEFPVPIRKIRGTFDLTLELVEPKNARGKFFLTQNPFAPGVKEESAPIRRVIQGVALSPTPHPPPEAAVASNMSKPIDMRDALLDTIDPTNPSWWKIFARRNGEKQTGAPDNGAKTDDLLSAEFLKMWQWGELQASVKSLTEMSNWGRWDSLWQRPLGSGHLAPLDSSDPRDASFIKLLSSGNPADPSWESYTVPIKEPNKPHILEIEYLPEFPQKLGVSILEPSVSGGIFPRTLDTGLIVGKDPLTDEVAHRVLRYSILFWPRTAAPTILLINRDTQNPAVYGRIRIYRAKDRFTAMMPPGERGKRSMTAVMSRPTFCDQFLAENAPATAGVVGAHSWSTIEQGAERLTGYLKVYGWDSLLLSVMGDGSTLYPSPILRPNPLFDSGIFLTEGNDPVRKDTVDYLLRLFDRENLTLTPLFSFNAPLPILESEIRVATRNHSASDTGIANTKRDSDPDVYYLLGTKGERVTKETGVGYNILHPVVQREVLRALDEFAARYADRSALRDIALDLSADTFVRLPDNIYCGLDDETIERFARETKLEDRCPDKLREMLHDFIHAQDKERYYRRATMIRDYLVEDWTTWRALTVSRFYHMAARQIRKRIPKARLLLVTLGSESADGYPAAVASAEESAEAEYRALLRHGIDLKYIRSSEEVVWIRSLPVDSGWRTAGLSADLTDPYIGLSATGEDGALFYRDVAPINIPSFDRVSPYHPTVTQISGNFSYSDYQNRERWAKQLAVSDARSLMDGGQMIPMGEEESQGHWIAAYRALPAEPFKTYIPNEENSSSGPVILRWLQEKDGFWGYLVSTAPFHCGVTLTLNCSPRAETTFYAGGRELTEPERQDTGLRWNCSLGPYDLIAFHVADPKVTICRVDTSLPIDICGEGRVLEQEGKNLIDRLRLAADGVESPLLNAGFEEKFPEPDFALTRAEAGEKENNSILGLEIPKFKFVNPFAEGKEVPPTDPISAEPGLPAGWHRFGAPEFSAVLDAQCRTEGQTSLKMTCHESAGGVVGQPFRLPNTGRLYVDADFGVPADLPEELPFFITLAGKQGGKPWQKRVYAGRDLLRRAHEMKFSGSLRKKNGVIWIRQSFLFDRLPTEETEDFTIRLELLPNGTVWVDDLHLYKLAFNRAEQESVNRMIGELETALREKDTMLLLRRINTSAAAMLATQLPNGSPEMMHLAMRDRPKTEDPQIQEDRKEIVGEGNGEKKPEREKEKSFLRKIFPW